MARREPWASQQPNYTNGDPGRGREVEGASGWEGGESSRDPLNQSSNAFASSALSLALALEQRMVSVHVCFVVCVKSHYARSATVRSRTGMTMVGHRSLSVGVYPICKICIAVVCRRLRCKMRTEV